ncbi:MAG: CDP-diacylglycerol--glycerol-3-phosphate 3-phosphatidyltransferase [Acidimicrobiia bacterium]
MSLPDALGVARIAVIPLIMALILADGSFEASWGLAAVLFALAAVTDILDGLLARRWNITTILGGFIDSTADKLLVSGSLLALLAVGRASVWVAFIIISREILVTAVRGVVALRGEVVPPSAWGKWKTALQFLAVFLAILRLSETVGPYYLDQYAMWIAAAATIASGYQYAKSFWDVIRSVDTQQA